MKHKTLIVLGVAYGLAVVWILGPAIAESLRPTEDVEVYVPNLSRSQVGQRVTLVGVTRFALPSPVIVKDGLVVTGGDGTFILRVTPEEARWFREGGPKAGCGLMQLLREPSWFRKIWYWLTDLI